jgi:hypothetical protein
VLAAAHRRAAWVVPTLLAGKGGVASSTRPSAFVQANITRATGGHHQGEQTSSSSPASSANATATLSGSETADSCAMPTVTGLAFFGVVRPLTTRPVVVGWFYRLTVRS